MHTVPNARRTPATLLRVSLGLLPLAGLGLAAAGPVHAQTVISGGTHTGAGPGAPGYDFPAQAPGSTTLTVTGGTFTGVAGDAAVPGGMPDGDVGGAGLQVRSGTATVHGGTFTGAAGGDGNGRFSLTGSGGDGLLVLGGAVTVTGGTFTGAPAGRALNGAAPGQDGFSFDVLNGALTVVGDFTPQVLTTGGSSYRTGSFTGTLADNTVAATYTYFLFGGGTLTLVNPAAAVPEPSQTATLGLGALGLAGLMVKARRRRIVAA